MRKMIRCVLACALVLALPASAGAATFVDDPFTFSDWPFASATFGEPADDGTVLWTADAEQNVNNEWAEINDIGISSGQGVVTSSTTESNWTRTSRQSTVHAQGSLAYKFHIAGADDDYYNVGGRQRTEVGMANPTKTMPDSVDRLFHEGDDLWISWQMYLPTNFTL